MTEPEQRRRRPTTACTVCRRRKMRCNRGTPCSNCVRSRRREDCVYDDAAPQPARQHRDGVRVLTSENMAPMTVERATASTKSTPGGSSRSPAASLTTSSAAEAASQASAQDVESMKTRIRQMEEQLSSYKGFLRSTRFSSLSAMAPGYQKIVSEIGGTYHIHQTQAIHRSVWHKTRLFGQSHWVTSIAPLAGEMIGLIEPYLREEGASNELSLMHKAKSLARVIKAQRAPPWPSPPTPDLPPKHLTDELVGRYLQTVETVYRILHIPTFRREYEYCWSSSEIQPNTAFIVQLKLILAIGTVTYDTTFSLRSTATKWIYEAQTYLSEPIFKPRLGMQNLQTQLLLLLAKELVDVGGDSVWISAGSLIRTAITMGFHRDPSQLPKVTPFAAEMRRRLWSVILDVTLQASLSKGGPPLLSLDDFDAKSPENFDDEDLVVDGSVPKAETEFTGSTIARALRGTFQVRLKVTKFLNDPSSGGSTYEDALRLDAELKTAFKQLRQNIQGCRNRPASSSFSIRAVDFIMHRYVSSLHVPYFEESLHNPAYAFSGKVVIDTSFKIWSATWPSSSPVAGASITTITSNVAASLQTQGEDDILSRFIVCGSGFFRTAAIQASFVLAAELRAQLQEDEGLGLVPLRQDLLSVVQEAKLWCIRCVEAGETNIKGCILTSIIAAQIDGIRQGLEKESLGRSLLKAVEEVEEMCLPLLEDMVAKTRTDSEAAMEELEQGQHEPSPGMTEDLDFMMSDAMFVPDSEGATGWAFDGSTKQGLSWW